MRNHVRAYFHSLEEIQNGETHSEKLTKNNRVVLSEMFLKTRLMDWKPISLCILDWNYRMDMIMASAGLFGVNNISAIQ